MARPTSNSRPGSGPRVSTLWSTSGCGTPTSPLRARPGRPRGRAGIGRLRSGMAALSATLLATVAAGRPHVVAVRPLYGGTDHVLATGLLGTRVTWATADTVAAAITDETGLIVPSPRRIPPLTSSTSRPLWHRRARCPSSSTTPSRLRCCRTRFATAPPSCCTRRPNRSVATATCSAGSSPRPASGRCACARSGP